MAMTDGLLAGRGCVNGIEGQSYFNQFLTITHTSAVPLFNCSSLLFGRVIYQHSAVAAFTSIIEKNKSNYVILRSY